MHKTLAHSTTDEILLDHQEACQKAHMKKISNFLEECDIKAVAFDFDGVLYNGNLEDESDFKSKSSTSSSNTNKLYNLDEVKRIFSILNNKKIPIYIVSRSSKKDISPILNESGLSEFIPKDHIYQVTLKSPKKRQKTTPTIGDFYPDKYSALQAIRDSNEINENQILFIDDTWDEINSTSSNDFSHSYRLTGGLSLESLARLLEVATRKPGPPITLNRTDSYQSEYDLPSRHKQLPISELTLDE